MSSTVWDRFNDIARQRSGQIALRHGSHTLSFDALHRAALAQAARLGDVAAGDRVLICGENGAAILALVPAIWRCGAIPVLLHPDAPAAHIAHAIATTAPARIFADAGVALPDFSLHDPIALAEGEGTGIAERPRRAAADPASILFTSGSTGRPKGVTQSGANLIDRAAMISALMGYREDDSILCPIPFAFDYGWGQVLSLLLEGIPLVLPEPRNAFGLCAAIETHRPTVLAAVPAVLADLTCGLAPIRQIPRASIRLITNTGSKIARPVFAAVTELFPEAEISLNYGLTETYRSASLPRALARSHPTSVGHAVPGAELLVLRPDGSLAGPGETGEIIHRGAGCFLGYWNDPVRTAEVLRPDPLGEGLAVFTGDLGHVDADGLLYIEGRRDRQLKSMGVRVAPDEIEAMLIESGLVADVAISSIPDRMLGDLIVACITLPKGADEKPLIRQLRAFARAHMSPYMQPRRYVVLPDLPRTTSAKVDYATLGRRLLETA